jgi:hypothetical protein
MQNGNRIEAGTRWYRRRWVQWTAGCVLVCLLAALIVAQHFASNAEPIVRQRIIDTVSERFGAPVELDAVHISVVRGLHVSATGLRVGYPASMAAAAASANGKPMIAARAVEFHAGLFALLHPAIEIDTVVIHGLEIHVPPSNQRPALMPSASAQKSTAKQESTQPDSQQPDTRQLDAKQPGSPLRVGRIFCDDAVLAIESSNPQRGPMVFAIQRLEFTGVDWTRSFHYDAQLTNPKPQGNIHAVGSFGPWQQADPRITPIDGDYNFDHADLNTIRGLGGMLSSTGHFSGRLDYLLVNGITDTPDFSIDTSNHPVPLHIDFNAIVDGTSGDTTLTAVHARMLHSSFSARGKIERVVGQGHNIDLDVDMPNVRMEDMLQLAVKTEPPLMRGALTLHTHLHLPPGKVRVPEKLEMHGVFAIEQVHFSNAQTQDKVDSLSMRAQGKPELAGQAGSDHAAEVASHMSGNFTLAHGMTTIPDLDYRIPGARVQLAGVYSLNGQVFEFKGHVRTDATASQMTTGWKSMLLKPVDPFLKKNGAGLELPVSISGTGNAPHIGLAIHGADESTADMQKDVREKQKIARMEKAAKK